MLVDNLKVFLNDKKKEIRDTKKKAGKKYSEGGYEKPYEYWNEIKYLTGKSDMLKELHHFIVFLQNMEKFGNYIPNEEKFIPTDDDLIGRDYTQWNPDDEWNKI
jgi:hypothetical protein